MLKLRLSRTGKKTQPSFRIVVQEHTASPKGKFFESLGFYRPASNPKEFKVDAEKIKYWISKGAKPSPTLANLLKKEGMEGMDKYLTAPNKKGKKKKEEEAKPQASAPAPAAAVSEAPKTEEAAPEEAPKVEEPAKPAEEPKPEQAPAQTPAKPEEPNQQAAPTGESAN